MDDQAATDNFKNPAGCTLCNCTCYSQDHGNVCTCTHNSEKHTGNDA